MSFGVGDLVECVDDSWPDFAKLYCDHFPVSGTVYTVRGIVDTLDGPGLWLVEIRNRKAKWADRVEEAVFSIRRFRPIRKPSIEIFRQIVADVRDGQKVHS